MPQLAKRAENGVTTPQKFHGTLLVPHSLPPLENFCLRPWSYTLFKYYRLIINSPDQLQKQKQSTTKL